MKTEEIRGRSFGDAGMALEMSVEHPIIYRILHPLLPVFDRDDLTLAQVVDGRPVFMVVDGAVMARYEDALRAYAEEHLDARRIIAIKGGEAHKTWRQVEALCEAALECRLDRHGVIVGVGGGTILDIAGFAASIFRRGVGYVRIATTLVGQVDVAIGVKHGVNLGKAKNIIGSFYPPIANINDLTFLHSVPRHHLAAGVAEVIKIAMLRDAALFDLLDTHARDLLDTHFQTPREAAQLIMERAERGMLRELETNLFETDLERGVDFGHTFSPAFETLSDFRVSHGHAVALDMLISTCLAVQRSLCDEAVLARLIRLCHRAGLPVSQSFCSPAMLHASLDAVRAHRGGALNLVVPTAIGAACFLQELSVVELQKAMNCLAQVSEADAGLCV